MSESVSWSRKFLSILLSFTLVMSLNPLSAYATDDTSSTDATARASAEDTYASDEASVATATGDEADAAATDAAPTNTADDAAREAALSLFSPQVYVDDSLSLLEANSSDVAQIGSKTYSSLSKAFDAVKSGETIKLLADCTSGYINVKTSCTLDLNGCRLTRSGVTFFYPDSFYLQENVHFTVKDSTTDGTGSTEGRGWIFGANGIELEKPGSRFTLESGIIFTQGSMVNTSASATTNGDEEETHPRIYLKGGRLKFREDSSYAIYSEASYTEVYMTGGVIEGKNKYSVLMKGKGSKFYMMGGSIRGGQEGAINFFNSDTKAKSVLSVTDGRISTGSNTEAAVYMDAYGDIAIDNGSITGGKYAVYMDDSKSTFTMNGGSIKRTEGSSQEYGYGVYLNEDESTFTLNGGTIEAYGTGVYIGEDDSTTTINGGSITATCAADDATEEIGTGLYIDQETNTITMNDGTITADSAGVLINDNEITFTLNGGAIKAKGMGIQTTNWSQLFDFTMNGGSVSSSESTGVYIWTGTSEVALKGGSISGANIGLHILSASLTIDDSTITAKSDAAVYCEGSPSVFTINGGTFTSEKGDAFYVCYTKKSAMQINGGTFVGGDHAFNAHLWFYNDTVLTITGGSFTSPNAAILLNGSDNYTAKYDYRPCVYVYGGTFTSTNATTEIHDDYADRGLSSFEYYVYVSGGLFSHPVASDHCANGFEPTRLSAKWYSVVKANGKCASVTLQDGSGTTYWYSSMKDAINAAGSMGIDCTVKLTAGGNMDPATISGSNKVTLDLNGCHIKSAGNAITVGDSATLEVIDTTLNGNGKIESTDAYHYGIVAKDSASVKVTDSVTVTSAGPAGIAVLDEAATAKLEVTGGSISGAEYAIVNTAEGSTLAVSGGTLTAGDESTRETTVYGPDGTVAISGGTFDKAVPYEYCAVGYIPAAGEAEGTYTVEAGYKISFDAWGGTPAPDAQYVKAGELATEPTTPTREGYNFRGWYTQAEGQGAAFDFSTAPAESATLYAYWRGEDLKFTVSFDVNGGETATPESQTIDDGKLATQPADPTREGYTFKGWSTSAEGGEVFNFDTPIVNDVTLYAQWAQNVASITKGGTTTIYSSLQDAVNAAEAGDTVKLLADVEATDRITLLNKNLTLDLNGKAITNSENIALYVYGGSLTVVDSTSEAQGSISGAFAIALVDVDSFTLEAGKLTGTWMGLYVNNGGTSTTAVDIKGGSITASGTSAVYALTSNVAINVSGGTLTGATYAMDLSSMESGLSLSVTGGAFKSGDKEWSGATITRDILVPDGTAGFASAGVFSKAVPDDACITNYFSTANSDETTKATYPYVVEKGVTVTIDANGGAWDDKSTTVTQIVAKGSKATEPVKWPSRPGYIFDGWYNGATKYDFNTPVTTDLNLTVKWEPITYTITYNLDGGTNDPNNPTEYTSGEESIELKDATKDGWAFAGWFDADGNQVTAINTGSTGDVTLTAKWVEPVARVVNMQGTFYFADLLTAMISAEDQGVVTLMQDVDLGSDSYTFVDDMSVTFDLNGHTLTSSGHAPIYVVDEASLIVTDSSEAGTGAIVNTGSEEPAIYTEDAVGLTIEGGSITATTYAVMANLVNAESMQLAVSGGKLTGQSNDEGVDISVPESVGGFVSGGVFTHPVPQAQCATGYEPFTNYDNTYGVKKINYTVTFDANGGELTGGASEIVSYGDAATKPTDPSREGYLFAGWTTDKAGANAYDFSAGVTESIVLYAQWSSAVAEVNGTTYVTLAEAVATAKAGDTVKLLASSTINTAVAIDKDLTIDLNNQTLTSTAASALEVTAGTLTLVDNTQVQGGKIACASGSAVAVTGSAAGLTIWSGTYTGKYAVSNSSASNVLQVQGGEFTGTESVDIASAEGTAGFISRGTFAHPVPASQCATGYVPSANDDFTYCVMLESSMVCKVGDLYFPTLRAAVAKTSKGDTITMIADEVSEESGLETNNEIHFTWDVTIDLNGHKVTVPNGGIQVTPGTLTITDSSKDAAGSIVCADGTPILVLEAGNLTVEAGTISGSEYAFTSFAADNNLKVTGGSITSGKDVDISVPAGTAGFVSGGTFAHAVPFAQCATGYIPTTFETSPVTYGVTEGYAVTFVSADRGMIDTQYVKAGEKATKPDDPTRKDYTFKEWTTDAEGTQAFDFTTPINQTTALYAQWSAIDYKITYNLDGGVNNPANPKTYTVESPTIKLAAPTKTGYTFAGWYNAEGNRVTEIATGSTGDVELTAHWALSTYTVSFDANGGTLAGAAEELIQYGKTAVEPKDPQNPGYLFSGWYTAATGGELFNFDTPIVADTTLYAQWTVTPTPVETVASITRGGTTTNYASLDDAVEAAQAGDTIKMLEDVTSDSSVVMMGKNITLDLNGHAIVCTSAVAIDTAEITLVVTDSSKAATGSITGTSTAVKVSYGGNFKLEAGTLKTSDATGAHALWAHRSAAEDASVEVVGGAIQAAGGYGIYLDGSRLSLKVTDGVISADYALYNKDANNSLSVSAGKFEGTYDADIWTPDGTAGFITGGVYAHWVPDWQIVEGYECVKVDEGVYGIAAVSCTATFEANGGVFADGSTSTTQTVGYKETVNAPSPAPTRDGYAFKEWTTDEAGKVAYDFSTPLTDNVALYAQWTKNPAPVVTYTVTFDANGGVLSGAATETVESGKTATKPADPMRSGYTFAGWTSDAAGKVPFDFTTPLTENITLYAQWTENPEPEKKIVALPSVKNATYDASEQTGLTVGKDALYTATGTLSATNAGGYTVTLSLKDKANCVWTSTGTSDDITVEWSIAKKAVTIKANDATMVAGDTLPAFTGEVEGVCAGDDLKVGYTVQPGSDTSKAGTYRIVSVWDTENANYEVSVQPGTLTVTAAPTPAPTKVEKPTMTAATDLVYNGSEQTGVTVAESDYYTVTGAKETNANTYTAKVSLNDKEKYQWADGTTDDLTLEWTIAKAAATIKVDSKEMTVGGLVPEFTGSIEGVAAGDDLKVRYELPDGADITKVGAYGITAYYTENANYEVSVTDGTLTVTGADKTALEQAIFAGNTSKEGVKISTDGSDVAKTDKWVTQEELDALNKAIEAATAVVNDANASQASVDTALAAMVEADEAFQAAKKAGTKVDPTPTPTSKVVRIAGDDRYSTMQQIVNDGFTAGSTKVAVLATGENFPDALVASTIAGAYDAPVLLTETGRLSEQAKAEIERLGIDTVYVLGGTASVSDEVLAEVAALGAEMDKAVNVVRVCGENRADTSLEAINVMKGSAKGNFDTVVVASGKSREGVFGDALSISPYAYAKNAPILLTDGDGMLTAEELAAIKANTNVKNIIIVGGSASVSDVEGQLGSGYNVIRLAGETRYETSAAIATWELAQGMSATSAAIATGQNFPDALAGAAFSGLKNSILLLADDTNSAEAVSVLETQKGKVETLYVYGGTNSVSETVKDACATAAGVREG